MISQKLILHHFFLGNSFTSVNVVNVYSDGPGISLNCAGANYNNGLCNVRSAWKSCVDYISDIVTNITQHNSSVPSTISCVIGFTKANQVIRLASAILPDASYYDQTFLLFRQSNISIPSNVTLNIVINGNGNKIVGDGTNRFMKVDMSLASPKISLNLLMQNISIQSFACPTGCNGGGMYLQGSAKYSNLKANIQSVSISDSIALNGGGIAIIDVTDLALSDSFVTSNHAYIMGGGLYIHSSSSIALSNVQVSSNIAAYGAGIMITKASSSISITQSKIEFNSAASDGGGLLINDLSSYILFTATSISNNVAGNGGGAVLIYGSYGITFNHVIISNNNGVFAGGLLINGGQYITLSYTTVSNNNGIYGGGMITNYASFISITYSSFVYNNALYIGGGFSIYEGCASISISYTDVSNNNAMFGGGIQIKMVSNVQISHSTITNNIGSIYGGGIYLIMSSNVEIVDLNVTHNKNTIANANGGGLFLARIQNMSISEMTIAYNSAGTNPDFTNQAYSAIMCFGGGLYVFNCFNCLYSKLNVYENSAVYGGGLYIDGINNPGQFVLSNNKIEKNIAVNSGGGVYLTHTSQMNVIFDHVHIENNQAIKTGGGIHAESSNMNIIFVSSYIAFNNASTGGGIAFFNTKNLNIIGAYVTNNNAVSNGGNIHFNLCQFTKLSSSTIQYGHSYQYGGGVAIWSGGIRIENTIISNNKARFGGGVSIGGTTQYPSELTSTSFTNNTAVYGGGIALYGIFEIKIGQSTFLRNHAYKSGGAIYIEPNNNMLFSYVDKSGKIIIYNFNSMEYTLIGEQSYYYIANENLFNSRGIPVTAKLFNHTMGFLNFCKLTAGDIEKAYIWNGAQIYDIKLNTNAAAVWGNINTSSPNFQISCPLSSIFANNTANSYGVNYATKIWTVQKTETANNNFFIQDYNKPLDIHASSMFKYLDYFEQSTTFIDGFNTWAPDQHIRDCPLGISSFGYLSGIVSSPIGTADNFTARCFPGKSMSLDIAITPIQILSDNSFTFTEIFHLKFRNCTIGEHIVNDACIPCPDGFYSFDTHPTLTTSCSKCPSGATCIGGILHINEGFWRNSPLSITAQRCPLKGACRGGTIDMTKSSNQSTTSLTVTGLSSTVTDLQCYEGYTGILCGTCSTGYYMSDQSCRLCKNDKIDSVLPLIIVPILLLIIVFIGIFFAKRASSTLFHFELPDYLSATLKILLTTYQIIGLLPYTLNIVFSESVTGLFQVLSYVNIFNLGTPQCGLSHRFTYFDTLVMRTCIPIGICVFMFIAYTIKVCSLKARTPVMKVHPGPGPSSLRTEKTDRNNSDDTSVNSHDDESADDLKSNILSIQRKYNHFFLFLCFLVLPSVTVTIFGAIPCINIDPDNLEPPNVSTMYMYNDLSVSCASKQYYNGAVYAIIFMLIYPIGIPLFNWWSLRKIDQDKSYNDEDRPLAFLYSSYRVPSYLYWDIIETGRRLTLTAVLSVIGTGTGYQIIVGLAFSMLFIWLYGVYYPYKNPKNYLLQFLAQFQIALTLVCAAIIKANLFFGYAWASTTLNVVLVLINLSTTIYAIHLTLLQEWSAYQHAYCYVANFYRIIVGHERMLTHADSRRNSIYDKYAELKLGSGNNITRKSHTNSERDFKSGTLEV